MKWLLQTLFFFFLVTQLCFAQWVQLGLDNKVIKDIAARNSNIFAITSDSSVYRSTDGGVSWLQIGQTGAKEIVVAPTGTVFMLKDTLFRSTDNGTIFLPTLVPQSVDDQLLTIAIGYGGTVFCGILVCNENGCVTYINVSMDDGILWSIANGSNGGGDVFAFRDQRIISFGRAWDNTGWGQFSKWSSDGGQTFATGPGMPGKGEPLSLCMNGNVLAGGNPGLFLSTDSCISWIQVSAVLAHDGVSLPSGGMIVGTDGTGIALFGDNGDSLGSFNEGLSNLNINTLTIDNIDYVYLGSDNGVWRRPLSEIITDVENVEKVPAEFLLSQNYPNPFNPSTKIKYSIPQSANVVIKAFDVLGNEIETLVNEEKPEGTYELTWYAENLPSGIYFYRIQAGSFVETKKMLLLK